MEMSAATPSPAGLKTLGHPVRFKMLGLLRFEGPATATTLAERLGLNTGATSYHLRQLAQHGFVVEDTERGNGRDRWWRAAHDSTRTGANAIEEPDEEDREAHDAFGQTVALFYTEQMQHAVEERMSLPAEWRRATKLADWGMRLTPARARALIEALEAIVEDTPAEDDEPDAAEFIVQLQAFPRPGRIS
jgi:predicted ArsR family transcriptional regulator